MNDELLQHIAHALQGREPVVLATIVRGEAGRLGRHVLLRPSGESFGDLEDAGLRQQLQTHAAGLFGAAESTLIQVGTEEIFLESLLPQPRLIIIGAVHVAVPLVTMAKALDFEVILIDPRSAFASEERFAHVDRLLRCWPQEALQEIGIDGATCIVLLTHDSKIDDPAITHAVQHAPAYLGVLGSRKTHAQRLERLRAQGLREEQLRQLHAPVGLAIGARSPAEIALSILAEIVAVRHGKAGAPAAA